MTNVSLNGSESSFRKVDGRQLNYRLHYTLHSDIHTIVCMCVLLNTSVVLRRRVRDQTRVYPYDIISTLIHYSCATDAS